MDADTDSNPHFDERMGVNKTKLLRPKRMAFQFVEEGKWSKQADIIRFKVTSAAYARYYYYYYFGIVCSPLTMDMFITFSLASYSSLFTLV